MSDIFQEVDEEVRREQLKKLWDRYGVYFIALAVLIVAGVAGWRGYDFWQSKKAAEFGAQFNAAAILSEQGKHDEAEKAFARIASEGTSGYRVLARMREAAELAERDPKAAVAAYDDLAASAATGQPLQDLAALRAGMILIDSAPLTEMTRRLEPLAAAGAPFRHSARELLAFAAWKAGDTAALRKWSQLVRDDAETPASLRSRVDVLMALAGETGKG
ncbi:MAG TPA: tetratricopeptide repeat protein [Xanthobacteraceae bacterium]|nr:tetratricopeptide repeat protein [Xanthobacteraceae bacterium]